MFSPRSWAPVPRATHRHPHVPSDAPLRTPPPPLFGGFDRGHGHGHGHGSGSRAGGIDALTPTTDAHVHEGAHFSTESKSGGEELQSAYATRTTVRNNPFVRSRWQDTSTGYSDTSSGQPTLSFDPLCYEPPRVGSNAPRADSPRRAWLRSSISRVPTRQQPIHAPVRRESVAAVSSARTMSRGTSRVGSSGSRRFEGAAGSRGRSSARARSSGSRAASRSGANRSSGSRSQTAGRREQQRPAAAVLGKGSKRIVAM